MWCYWWNSCAYVSECSKLVQKEHKSTSTSTVTGKKSKKCLLIDKYCFIENFISFIIICIWLVIETFIFFCDKSRIICFIQQIQYILMFDCLYYSVTFNESKEKFGVVFCCFSAIKNNFALFSSSNFSMKLPFWRNSCTCLSW